MKLKVVGLLLFDSNRVRQLKLWIEDWCYYYQYRYQYYYHNDSHAVDVDVPEDMVLNLHHDRMVHMRYKDQHDEEDWKLMLKMPPTTRKMMTMMVELPPPIDMLILNQYLIRSKFESMEKHRLL